MQTDDIDLGPSVAVLSRPYSAYSIAMQSHSTKNCGRKQQNDLTPAPRVNWTSPFIWSQIESVANTVGYPWSPTEIVRRLCLLDSQTFRSLRPQRISQWRDHSYPNVLKWTDAHMRSIKAGNWPHATAYCRGILVSAP